MPLPKRKNDIKVYAGKELLKRRQELLDKITKSDTFLPDSVLHDDLDLGMLNFVKGNLKIISDGEQIPVIPQILTVQRWSEISNNWTFSDEDRNIKLPFISVIRKPDVQPGTNPAIQRTIPDRRTFHYATVPTWNGTQMGADVYKIPQPIAVDISFDVVIVCQKFRDLNRFNKIALQKFASRQSYTIVKGHYIPIIMDTITDNSPIDTLDGRRFYMQTYLFKMLGFLIDPEEFEVKPAINRLMLLTEFVDAVHFEKRFNNKSIQVTTVTFHGDGNQTVFGVGEAIRFLFYVSLNGIAQALGIDFYHISQTSKITFVVPPPAGFIIVISYYAGRHGEFLDSYGKTLFLSHGKTLFLSHEYFKYDGTTTTFTVTNKIDSLVYTEINGLIEEDVEGFSITGDKEVTLTREPVAGSVIGICYFF